MARWSRSVVGRGGLRSLVGCLSVALTVSLFPAASVAWADETSTPVPAGEVTAQEPGPDGLVPLTGELVRPDWVSASITARASHRRVEVLKERSETRRVWVHPDGHVQEEVAAAPVRFRDATATDTAGWRAIDTTLVDDGQGVHARAVPQGMSVAAVPGDALVSSDDGRVSMQLDGLSLPKPVLDGSTAIYRDVLPGVDARVEVRPVGFELVWQVTSKAGVASLVSRYGASGVVSLPTTMEAGQGTDLVSAADGSITQISTTDKKVQAELNAPMVYDAAEQKTIGHGVPKAAKFVLGAKVKKTKKLKKQKGSKATQVVTQAPVAVQTDMAWLTDPSRVFPITIDPTYANTAVYPIFDTFVQQGYTTDQSTASELKLGNNGSGQVARSFLNFDAAAFKGKQVTSASLSLFERYSWSCTAKPWSIYDAGLATTASRWTAQPAATTKRTTSTEAKGYSSACPAARINVDMTAQAKAWSATSAAQVGMMLRADDETDPYGWKRFDSNDGSYRPVMSLNYDRMPGTPAVPTMGNTATVGGKTFEAYPTPKLSGVVPSDADGNTVRLEFAKFTSASATTGGATLCTTSYAAAGTTATCTPAAAAGLTDNSHVWVRSRAYDSMGYSAWSAPQELWVTVATPPTPTITCDSSANGSWSDTVHAAELCYVTVTAVAATSNSAATAIRWSVDGKPETITPITQPTTTTPQKIHFAVGGTAGWHSITATAQSPVGRRSAQVTYGFGYGAPSISSPAAGQTTTDTVAVKASAPPKGTATVTSAVQWRITGSSDAAWAAVPASNTFTTTSGASTTEVAGMLDTTSLVGLKDASGIGPVKERVPASVDVRVCVTYTPGGVKCTLARKIVRVPHAFGTGFPTTDAGPGEVALWTGELQVSESDADLPGPNSAISVSRTHNSFAGDVSAEKLVFGPGWVAGLDGGDEGLSASEVIDNTRIDGTIAVVSEEGEALVFTTPTRRTTAAFTAGVYAPADDQTATSGITLTVTAGATPIITLRDEDGTKTRFTATAASTAGADSGFTVTDVTDPAIAGATTYQRDAQGRVTAIIAPVATGVAACVPGTRTAGCRVLKLSYNTQGLVDTISAQVDTEATDRVLSSYTYNTDKTMATQTDAITGLTTKYSWSGSEATRTLRLAGITPPGQDGFTFAYANNRLDKVTRALPATVEASDRTVQLAAFVYNQPTDVSNFDLGQFDGYPLPRRASKAFAVFGPDQKITGAPAKGDAAWQRAQVYLTDAEGYTVHDGSYGAGAWQWSATVYGDKDNVVQSWDDRATQQLRDGGLTDITAASTQTTYNSDITNAAGVVVTEAGTLVTQVMGPARMMVDNAGQSVWARPQTDTLYDQGAPNGGINPVSGQPYRLPTTVTTSSVTPGDQTWDRHDLLGVSTTSYAGTSPGGKTGWELGQPTATTTRMGATEAASAADITRETVYDDQGRTIEQRQPSAAGNSADAGTRKSVYYTAGANAQVAACGSKPQWAGWLCQTMPGAGSQIPTERTTSYTWDGQAAQSQTINGSTVLTTETTYDAKSRPVTVSTTATGLTGSTAVPAVTTSYDSLGQVTGTSSSAGTTTRSYDTWGRQLTYTNTPAGQGADSSTTTYDALGQVTQVSDGNGSTRYTYDGTDANGATETRGLLTKVEQTSGGITHSATAAYDAQGSAVVEKLPGALTRRHSYDPAGELIDLVYSGQGTDPDTGQAVDDQPWFGWSATTDAAGRTVHEWSTDGGSAYASGKATASDRTYSYDKAGRLVQVDDITGNPADQTAVPCTRRSYGFDANGNRTSQASATSPACTTAATSTTRAYDAADRPLTGANGQGSYTYDTLGRQTIIPAADTTHPANGDMTLAYYDTDAAQRITQGDTSVSFTLDGAGRRMKQDTAIGSVITGTPITGSLVRHYTDDSDNPAWSVDTRNNTSTATRYAALTGDGMGITFTTTGDTTTAELALSGIRGDVNATIKLDGTNPAAGIDSWNDYTEYGQPATTDTPAETGPSIIGYGWLGTHERATLDALGITLMGARLYNQMSGLFTSRDPIYGGNETSYGYPNDPVNRLDLDGLDGSMEHLSAAEREALRKVRGGEPCTGKCRKDYNRARQKMKKNEKVEGKRNNQKQRGGGKYHRWHVPHWHWKRIGFAFVLVLFFVVIVAIFPPAAGAVVLA